MHETPEELTALQDLLDASAATAGPHLRDIITNDRRMSATALTDHLQGMRLITVATATADGRPLTGPFDGYFLHGSWWFSSGPDAVRIRHLKARPAVSATYLPGEQVAVTVHGQAELFDLHGPQCAPMRQAMLDHYLPKQGPAFQQWMEGLEGGIGVRIDARKLFTFAAPQD
ncbi:pyridoxamine 5'-phosphate oxidase family protein [Catenulispora pinisilvae]|uniref:pyridoxamine 5'-phosphate oxidase family protein n=1 Tax=Catenulispora pinisilvae TaxID=2705253 RepID=UPI001890BEAC|nr:pyridoxamine 5'-phosphate oxidase family protein [Catenulispora pinisilvae]